MVLMVMKNLKVCFHCLSLKARVNANVIISILILV